jgi:lipoprotein-anchoring transpeptidase ErfK/SrfK
MRKAVVGLIVVISAVSGAKLFGTPGAVGGEHRRSATTTPLADAAAALPPPARPAFIVGRPQLLDRGEQSARIAAVTRTVNALAIPHFGAERVATLIPKTEEGTTNVVLILEEAKRKGAAWLRVRLPVLPNGQTAWVPRRALGGFEFVHTRLVVDRAQLRATLFEGRRAIFHAPVGIGTARAPTPPGEFYVRLKLAGFNDPFYGPVAFGTNARSAVLTDWPGGGYIGIHGTNAPELIPGQVSHGCIRMRNEDIITLGRLMPVGTLLTIR